MPAEASKRISRHRNWIRWLGTALSAGLFAWLLTRQNWQLVWENLRALPVWVLLVALGLYFLGIVLNAVRWYVLLQAPPVKAPAWEVVKMVFLGSFVSNFLPSTIGGDAVRIVSLLRFTEERAVSIASVIIDRFVNVAAMFTIVPFSFITFGSPFSVLNTLQSSQAHLLTGFIFSDRGLLKRAFSKFTRAFEHGRAAFKQWFRHPWIMVLAFIISWFSVFVIFLAIYTLAQGLGIPVALYQVMGVTAITYLLTLLPISFNGYGVREVSMTALYIYLGATVEQASTLAIVSRFFMLAVTLPGALWFSKVLTETIEKEDLTAPVASIEP